jgi:hypothetical protein
MEGGAMMADIRTRIEEANQIAVQRMIDSQAVWIDVRKAIEVCPGLKRNMIMHAGPPISWDKMASSQKNAVRGALIYEGLAGTMEEADHMIASGEIELSPCHEHNAVGSMCGVTSPSMPVLVVKNETFGNEGYILIYESPDRQKLSFGSFGEKVLENLRWIDEVGAPVLKALIERMGPLNLNRIISRALTMGDELHSRNFASTATFALEVAPYLVRLDFNKKILAEVADFIRRSDQFFVHFAMAAGKVTADAANGIEYSTVVTAMARNGVEVGIRVSGLPGQWFTGPASPIEGLFFGNYSSGDAQPDMGDSAITETIGLGAFAHAASPALALTKGHVDWAMRFTREMEEISVSNNPNFGIPALGGKGSPVGVDIRRVLEKGITPAIDTGIAHKQGGQIGVGTSRAPIEAFKKALQAFLDKYDR